MAFDDGFIIRTNITRFRLLLLTEIDGTTRRTIERLLAEFEAVPEKRSDR